VASHESQVDRVSTSIQALIVTPLRRFLRDRDGVAAVEFAFIMPVMLVLYFGVVVLGQGIEISRKVQLASRTLADLTTQQLPSIITGSSADGNCPVNNQTPCVSDSNLNDFFAGAKLVMMPFEKSKDPPVNVSMTVSLVVFDNLGASNTSGCCKARVVWSASYGPNSVLRPCGIIGLTPKPNGSNGATFMPYANYPGGNEGALVANGVANSTDYYMIVADVSYTFKPGYDFKIFNWGDKANGGSGFTMNQTSYMTPRNSATVPITWTPAGGVASGVSCKLATDYYVP
jgi:Flp pilus assembly pilin Flp